MAGSCCRIVSALIMVQVKKRTHLVKVRERDWMEEGARVMVGPLRHLPSFAEEGGGRKSQPVRPLGKSEGQKEWIA